MWEAFQRFRALDSEAQRVFGRAVILLPWVMLSLRLRGFRKTQAHLQEKLSRVSREPENVPGSVVQTTCRMVKAAGRHGLARPNCLEESLVLWYFLQRENVPAALRIGVRKSGDEFEAHAWVAYQGTVLNQGDEWTHPHYAAFESEFSELPGKYP
jgi:hypothetical protein